MKVLYVLSPNDRFNYGDLLFSHIVEKRFGPFFDKIVQCSIKGADMSFFGGCNSYSFHKIYEASEEDDNYLIVAGGECLASEWLSILAFVNKKINFLEKFLYHVVSKNMRFRLGNSICKTIYKAKTNFPFALGKNELHNFKRVFYNAVGGIGLIREPRILNSKRCRNVYDSVDYLAVRDKESSLGLNKMGIRHFLCPDSAILMSDYFDDSFLMSNCSINITEWPNRKHLFFQIALRYLRGKEKFFAEMLERISCKYDIKMCLCPIGTALNHDDQQALKKIASLMQEDHYDVISLPNVWDIMWLIKNSLAYVGTSLHGAITAMSFDVPFVAHSVVKVDKYLQCWVGDKSALFFGDCNEIEDKLDNLLSNSLVVDAKIQKDKAQESFKLIESLL